MRTARVAIALGVVLSALVAIPAAASASPVLIVVQAENARGTLRCTAMHPYANSELPPPGHKIEFLISVTNLSSREQMIGDRGYRLIRPVGGHVVWSTLDGAGGGDLPQRPIGPGVGRNISNGVTTRVRWSGPLEIRPVCPGTGVRMPWIEFEVAVPTSPASDAEAIAAAAAFPGSPWAGCVPGPSGTVTGVFEPPDGASLSPITMRCWADVRHEDGFDVVALSMVSPADAPDISIPEPTDVDEAFFAGGDLPGEGSMLAMRWSFVVTADETRPVLFQLRERAPGTGIAPSYLLKNGTWSSSSGVECGFTSYGFVPDGRALFLDWYTVCEGNGASSAMRTRILRG